MSVVRFIRRALARADRIISRIDSPSHSGSDSPPGRRQDEIREFLLTLDQPSEDARAYLSTHFARVIRTLSLVPEPGPTRRVLELGAYMQMTPVLGCILRYDEVRGAYYGSRGAVDTKISTIAGREVFRCDIDLFDAEKDLFPYPSGHFDTVLACEIIEHLLHDPMHMLLEIRRVLIDAGTMIITTPNIASFASVARLLRASRNPQICSKYANPERDLARLEVPHVREYTPQELRDLIQSAGFEIIHLFTENIANYNQDPWIQDLLVRNGYSDRLRGEQAFCIASKKGRASVERYPDFLYER